MTCDKCSLSSKEGYRFCPFCGSELNTSHDSRHNLDLVIMILAPLILAVLVTEFAYMWAGSAMTFEWLADKKVGILLLVPILVAPFSIGGITLQLFWIVILLAITASVILLIRETIDVVRVGKDERKSSFRNSSLYWLVLLFSADLLISVVLSLTSSPGEIPDMETGFVPKAIFSFADAAFWEEIITRVGYIGLPMAVVALVCKKDHAWKYILGGFGFSRLSVALLVISSMIFGFAHLSGWGLWKILPTAIGGILIGYLYIRFGIHASIVFHFILDFTSVMMDGAGIILLFVFMLAMIIAGFVCIPMALSRLWGAKESVKELPNLFPDDHSSIFFRR